MNLKEKMMETMMGNMTADEKKEMMNKMMEKFFADMTTEEKQNMMKEMMPKMMSGLMGNKEDQSGSNPMGGKSSMMDMMSMMMGGKSPMMGMMNMMMGSNSKTGEESEKPWDMCKKMMSSITKSSEMATFATPEIRGLFDEWIQQIEEEFLNFINSSDENSIEKLVEHFKLTKESVTYILTRLAQKGKIKFNFEKE